MLITYDRPGYGMSDVQPGRSIADAADDVRAIADTLMLDTFAVLGRSGGGPHALACAALLPDRVVRVASLVGPAPIDASGLDWLDGMVPLNRLHYGAAQRGLRYLAPILYPRVVAMRSDPEHLVRQLEAEGREAPLDPNDRCALVESMAEAVGRSLDGWAGDHLALTRPWGFDPAWITVPTLLWHAADDVFVPVAHGRWLGHRIKGSVLTISHRSGHLDATAVQRDTIHWLTSGAPEEQATG